MYRIEATKQFQKDIKFYENKKHFTNIEEDVEPIINKIEKGEFPGDEIPGIRLQDNEHSFKVRAANANTHQSEKDGYRIIYYVIKDNNIVYLLTIYYKKDDNRIPTNKEIVKLIKKYCL